MKVLNPIWNTFNVGNSFPISMDFELIKRFFRQTDLNELWSDRLIENIIPNPSKLHFGQEVLHGDL
jgi:hypothetical protein